MTLNFNDKKIYIIAEIGVNHNGKVSLAKKLILLAKKSGADAVKFQSFKANSVVTKFAHQAPYQKRNMKKEETQLKMLKRYELRDKDYFELKNFSKKNKIDFISSAFDTESLSFLIKNLKLKIIKIPSGEINNILILKKLIISNYKILISTGMSNYKEIVDSINTIVGKNVYKLYNGKIKIIDKKYYKKSKKKSA